jgi:hypothetical protein
MLSILLLARKLLTVDSKILDITFGGFKYGGSSLFSHVTG